ncbi:spore coat protein [Mangrovibacillus cuniculi]|uniref:Spore coat protein CotH n=1 Tax=Mangrovibacillus cuniculi TaxID=2593652 RepID=A0A7S8HFE0_9BACI|nr:spore coat protein [Mangrovibacillus cuniculi]QPC46657.1 spore coat protein CotH [Mangrovibacillus cuniculi]
MHCRPKVMPAVVHPTKCCVTHSFDEVIVPHIHPTHTTNVNHTLYKHQHYFPQTASNVNEVSNQQFNCGGNPPGPGFPGAAAPGFQGPAGPGFPRQGFRR